MGSASRYDRYRRDATDEETADARALYAAAELLSAESGPAGWGEDAAVTAALSQALYAGSRELANGRVLARELRTALRDLAAALHARPEGPRR